jgi:pantoate--beta-alanine ligase
VIVLKKSTDLTAYLSTIRQKGIKIGFVPTMGALHNGHISLIDLSKQRRCFTICSIFINPIQFNDPKDYEQYPVTLVSDMDMLIRSGCDVLYLPSVQEIYPEGVSTSREDIPLNGLDFILEGASRPGHFQGVAHVVKRLLDTVMPDQLFMGQKDFQQVLVVKKMIAHFSMPVEVITGPIIREANGLAMSSRNTRLSADVRSKSGVIYAALKHVHDHKQAKPLPILIAEAKDIILKELPNARIDYLIAVDTKDLSIATEWNEQQLVLLIAVWVEGVRLLDNILL